MVKLSSSPANLIPFTFQIATVEHLMNSHFFLLIALAINSPRRNFVLNSIVILLYMFDKDEVVIILIILHCLEEQLDSQKWQVDHGLVPQ